MSSLLPTFQLGEHRQALFLSTGKALIISEVFEFTLDAIQFVNRGQCYIDTLRLTFRLHLLRIDILALHMRPATQALDTRLGAQAVIARVIVSHQVVAIIG